MQLKKVEVFPAPAGEGGEAAKAFQPRRGRPTADQAEAINSAILAAASRLFQAKGFDGATMGAVAEAVGISKATLYSRYADKLALLRAVMEERLTAWGAASKRRALPEGADLEERLRRYAVTLLLQASSDEFRSFEKLASASWNEAARVVSAVRDAGRDHFLRLIVRDIEAAGAAEGAAPRDARLVAVAFLGLISGLLKAEANDAPVAEAQARELAAFAVSLLLRGRAAW